MYTYMLPRDALFHAARAKLFVRQFASSHEPTNVWEGITPSGACDRGYYKRKPTHWDCAFWRTTDGDTRAYFSKYVDNLAEQERSKLPFFVADVRPKEGRNRANEIDITKQLRWFAWKGNEIGGLVFWRWFMLEFGGGLKIEDSEITVIDSETFEPSVLDPARLILL